MCRNDFPESLVPTPLKWRNYATKVSIKRGRSGDTTPVWDLCDEIRLLLTEKGVKVRLHTLLRLLKNESESD